MHLTSKSNEQIHFLFCVIYSEYTLAVPSKDKRSITTTNVSQKFLDESSCKPNKTQVDKESKFYNRSMKSWLQDNDSRNATQHVMKENLLLPKDSLEP